MLENKQYFDKNGKISEILKTFKKSDFSKKIIFMQSLIFPGSAYYLFLLTSRK